MVIREYKRIPSPPRTSRRDNASRFRADVSRSGSGLSVDLGHGSAAGSRFLYLRRGFHAAVKINDWYR